MSGDTGHESRVMGESPSPLTPLFHAIVSMPDPLRYVRTMTCHGLARLIDELSAVEKANEFQARIFAFAMSEAVLRWKQSLVSVEDGERHESPVTGHEDTTVQPGVFQKP